MTAPVVHLVSAGAAKGLVAAVEAAFGAQCGAAIDGTFGAVGAMREKLLAGAPCDLVVLTGAMLDDLAREGRVDGSTIAPLGRVRTGVAVREGDPAPPVATPEALRAALAAADAVFLPDPERATAGIHFMGVLRALDLARDLAPRLRPFPNGAAAMAALAASRDARPIGCTQVTEIRYTPGVRLAGTLPPAYELSTLYAGAVARGAREPALAARLLALLAGPQAAGLREAGGFEGPSPGSGSGGDNR